MATMREMKRVIKINSDFKAAKVAYLEAKDALVADRDLADDEATAVIDNVIARRRELIDAAIKLASENPLASMYIGLLKDLARKAQTSPSIREQLVNAILDLDLG